MRSRNIKPGFFKNEDLGEASPLARILFTGLWCMADRDGFLEYRPKRIKIELIPYDSEDVEKLLEELRSCSVIDFYYLAKAGSSTEPAYIHVRNFTKHQNPHKQEKESKYRKLHESREITRQLPNNTEETSELVGLIPDSFNLITDPILAKKNVLDSTPLEDIEPELEEEGNPGQREFVTEDGITIDADTGEQITPFDEEAQCSL